MACSRAWAAVVGMHGAVAVAVENNGGDRRPAGMTATGSAALAHGGERRGHVGGGSVGEAGMDPDRGVQIAVGGAHDGRGGASGREAGDEDALGIHRIVLHDLAGDARDQRGLAFVALLVGAAEPVPAFRRVGVAALRRIDHEAVLFFCDEVHPGAGGEIVRRLGAAVQHDDQRKRLPLMVAAGDEELVGLGFRPCCCRCLR